MQVNEVATRLDKFKRPAFHIVHEHFHMNKSLKDVYPALFQQLKNSNVSFAERNCYSLKVQIRENFQVDSTWS